MRIRRALSGLFVLALGALILSASAQAADCKLTRLASVDMQTDPRPMIDVTIAGKPYHFLVDTGAVFSEIASDVATNLGLATAAVKDMEIYGAGGEELKRYAVVEDFNIGRLHADKMNMAIRDRKEGSTVDGVLGPDILMQYDVDFDFGAHKFNLFSQDHCPNSVVYWSTDYADASFDKGDRHVAFDVTLDDHTVSAALDTGSTSTLLAEHVARQTYGLSDQSQGMETDNTASGYVKYRYRFKSLSVGGLAVANPLVYILPDLAEKAFHRKRDLTKQDADPLHREELVTPDLIRGMNVLSKLHVYISYKDDKLYFTSAGPQ
jgi:predicted aspartyl protease